MASGADASWAIHALDRLYSLSPYNVLDYKSEQVGFEAWMFPNWRLEMVCAETGDIGV